MLNNIQVLRACAALAVALAHLNALNPASIRFGYGTFGVELFFVISGFVMVYITARRPLTPLRFFANRLARIVPLYWLMTLAVFGLAAAAPALLSSTHADPVELIKSLFFIPFLKESGLIQPILFLGWTLNYEMFFYSLFALSLFLPDMRLRVGLLAAVLVALVGWGLMVPAQTVAAAFYTQPIMLEFAYGMVLGLAYPRLGAVSAAFGWAAIALGLVLLPVLSQTPALVGLTNYIRGGCALLIVLGTLVLQARGLVARSRALLLLGASSYALYLVHPFAFIPIEKAARHWGFLQGWPLVAMVVIATLTMVASAIVVHLTIERGFENLLKRRRPVTAPG